MLVRFQEVSRNYGQGQGVFDLTFQLDRNQKIGLLGLNGSGKTTVMRLMAGLLLPDQGRIDLSQQSPRQSRAALSYLSDKSGFDSWMTRKDILRFMAAFYPDFDSDTFTELCDAMQVALRPIGKMSKGQQQCLRLAASFARKVPLYILDEPLSGIDMVSRKLIVTMLEERLPINSSILISTHEIKDLEGLLDRILIMKQGRLVLDESGEEACNQASSLTQRFIELHQQK